MIGERRVQRRPVQIPTEQVLRLLGMGRGARPPRPSLASALEDEMKTAHRIITPRSVTLVCHQGVPDSDYLADEQPVALAAATIGPALEQRVAELHRSGSSTRALLLDAIGSAAVEAIADRLNGDICEAALAAGQAPDTRRSPGYGRWRLTEQRVLFDLLRPGEIELSLNERCMMAPSKSVTFAVPLQGGRPGGPQLGRCLHCGLADCTYRELRDSAE